MTAVETIAMPAQVSSKVMEANVEGWRQTVALLPDFRELQGKAGQFGITRDGQRLVQE